MGPRVAAPSHRWRCRRRARRLLEELQGRYRLLLDVVTEAPIPLAPVAGSAATLMTDYGIASYDAVHAATAIAAIAAGCGGNRDDG